MAVIYRLLAAVGLACCLVVIVPKLYSYASGLTGATVCRHKLLAGLPHVEYRFRQNSPRFVS